MSNGTSKRLARGFGFAMLTTAIVGIPTDVVDTSYFTRMTPVRWWEYAVLALTVMLTALWATIPRPTEDVRGRGGVIGAVTMTIFAIACPTCNKIVVGLLGPSGALDAWSPFQPMLAGLALSALGSSVLLRWRRSLTIGVTEVHRTHHQTPLAHTYFTC